MGVHHVTWQTTASGLEDEYIHAAALSWLVGDEESVEIQYGLHCKINKFIG